MIERRNEESGIGLSLIRTDIPTPRESTDKNSTNQEKFDIGPLLLNALRSLALEYGLPEDQYDILLGKLAPVEIMMNRLLSVDIALSKYVSDMIKKLWNISTSEDLPDN